MPAIFITGGTGYMGKRLIKILLLKGYPVKALVRAGSERKLPPGCDFVIADPFDEKTFAAAIPAQSIFVQLLGVPHPGPRKKELFKTVDLASVKTAVKAAHQAGVAHFIYVSVAQMPTKIMRDYQLCRAQGEESIKEKGLHYTFIRPWYVIGPGHYWPLLMTPFFPILEMIPSTSKTAKALRLVSLKQMLHALLFAIENPAAANSVLEIEQIRKF